MRRMQRSYGLVHGLKMFEGLKLCQAQRKCWTPCDVNWCAKTCWECRRRSKAWRCLGVISYKFVNFPIMAQTWKLKVTIAVADGEGFAIEPNTHFASELEDRIQSEDLASLQIAAVQDTFTEMSGHKCCQAGWSMGRWVHGPMQWSFHE